MISVQFRSVGSGTCSWCRKEKNEVFTVAFDDRSFSGPMCWNDLRCAIRFKVPGSKDKAVNGSDQSTKNDA